MNKTVTTSLSESMFSGPVVPLLVRLSLPMLAGMLVQIIYSITDTWWVSRIDPLDPGIVGGVGLIFPVFMVTMGIGSGISVGVNSLVARSIGKNDSAALKGIAESGLLIATIVSLATVIPGYLFADRLVTVLGATGSFHANGLAYFVAILPVLPLSFASAVFTGILQGEGRMKQVMTAMILGTVANLILDPLFIFGLNRGIGGAAEATVLAQVITLIYTVSLFVRKIPSLEIAWNFAAISPRQIGDILSVGTSQALSMLIMGAAILVMNIVVVKLDSNAMTALTLGQRVDQLIFTPIMAISGALVTAVGQNFGRGNIVRIRELWRKGVIMAASLFLVLASVVVFAAPWIFPLFSDVPEVIRYAVLQTRVVEFTFIVACSGILARAVFQAMGYSIPSLILTALRLFILAIPAMMIYVYVFDLGVPGVWYGLITGNIVSGVVSFIWVERMLTVQEKKAGLKIARE